MCILDKKNNYSRLNNILYSDGIPIIRFTRDRFPDWEFLQPKGVIYMQKYMNMFPQYWEHYKQEQIETGQITLKL